MAEHDLVTQAGKDSQGKEIKGSSGPEIVLSNEQVPELEDYNTDSEIELKVKAKVIKVERPQQEDNVSKSVEPADYTLELITAEVLNLSPDRKKADKMGLDMKEYKVVQSKRKGGGGSIPTGS